MDTDTLINTIQVLIEDENGDHVYSLERALFGYLPATEFLVIPASIYARLGQPPELNNTTLGKSEAIHSFLGPSVLNYRSRNSYIRGDSVNSMQMLKLILANYIYLRKNGMQDKDAFIVGSLRARWLILGCLYKSTSDRNVTYDEVITCDENDDWWAPFESLTNIQDCFDLAASSFDGFINNFRDNNLGAKWLTRYAETIWSISEHLFRVRGHHYKVELEGLIKRMFLANSEGNASLPDNFPFAKVFHTAIHPFGVKALPIMNHHFIAWGKVGNAMIIRTSGAPNGFAAITTTSAALKMVSAEPWYNSFKDSVSDILDDIHEYASQILDDKFAYHISARLYDVAPKRTLIKRGKEIPISQAEAEVNSIAPTLQAFISIVKEQASADRRGATTYSFSNAKVLEKRASTNPLQTMRVQAMIEYTLSKINESNSISEAIKSTFPNVDRSDSVG